MRTLSEKELAASLKSGVGRLYAIVSSDAYLILSAEKAIEKADDFEVFRFDCESASQDELTEPFFGFSLSGSKKLIILNNYEKAVKTASMKDFFTSLLSDIPDFVTVIISILFDGWKLRSSKAVNDALELSPSSALVLLESRAGSAVTSTIGQMAKDVVCACTEEAAQRMAELVANDLMKAKNEVEKAAALCGYTTIEKKHVDAICSRTPETNVFDMISAMERGDKKKALGILDDMLFEHTEPAKIAFSLFNAFINLYRAKLAKRKGLGEEDLFRLFDYKKGDKKVSIAMKRAGGYGDRQLEDIIELLYGLDCELKSSLADKNELLRFYFMRLMTISEKR